MPRYMLDTNIASALIRKSSDPVEQRWRALADDDWCISAVTRSELRFGVELLPDAARLAKIVDLFLMVAPVAPWDAAAADAHARVRAKLQLAGKTIGAFDEMIAGHALSLGMTLVTDNEKHFKRVDGLAIENWMKTQHA
ncbi:MAG: type II toxin-antitoxin system VapC family toxin [Desulfobulbus sp.]|nr:type II toxin-antitoxin system VapC family toxin [Desulfobulbus sp.]